MARKPWFPFYVDDFWQDEAVSSMTFEEVGLYLRLLCLQWREGSIPADPEKLARICGIDGPAMAGLMAQVGNCFTAIPSDPPRLINKRLKLVSMKAESATQKLSEQGKAGARARWGGHGPANGPGMAPASEKDGPAIAKGESDIKQLPTPPSPPSGGTAGGDDLKIGDLEQGKQGKSSKSSRKSSKSKSDSLTGKRHPTPPPDGFEPSGSDIAWFRKTIGEVQKRRVYLETQNFLSHHARKGNEFVDWNAAWKNWMVRESKAKGWDDPKGSAGTGRDGDFPEVSPNLVRPDEED